MLNILEFTVPNGIQQPGCNDLYEVIYEPSVSKFLSSMGVVPEG